MQTQAGVPGGAPHRVLVVSADMGGGHNATATALEEAAQRLWPGSETRRLDALDVMGPGVGPLFRRIYVGNVEQTPWLYEFFYASLWRHRWFARASKRLTGSWCGRRLAAHVDRFDPDLIVSTYPLGSAGLAWLRTHRGLPQPAGCWISDFAPHPFWVYPELDANFVVHEAAAPIARVAEPGTRVDVCAPPVTGRFRPGDKPAARERLGLRPEALVVLLSCGAYAFGDVGAIVKTLVDCSATVQVLAACGRNTETLETLEALGLPPTQLMAMGWTDDMAGCVDAADLVVTNAGGATALEALAAATPVVTTCPIAAHGDANADLMTVAGLTELCSTLERLHGFVTAAAEDRSTLDGLEARIREHLTSHDLDAGLAGLAGRARQAGTVPARPWRMRSADAFFAHAETERLPQELGTVLELGPVPGGGALTVQALRESLAPRFPGLPPGRRELARGGWLLHDRVDVTEHVTEHVLEPGAPAESAWSAAIDLWSKPLPPAAPAWRMRLVRGLPDGRALLAIKMHHCQADGISAIGLLDRLLDPAGDDPLTERRTSPAPSAGGPRAALPARIARGLVHLAARGRVPPHPLNKVPPGTTRDLATVALPWPEVRRLARRSDARPHEVVLALAADALDRALRPAGLLLPGRSLRAMVPVAMRAPRLDRIFGNWTGSLAVDLPMGAMGWEQRLAQVRAEVRGRAADGEAEAGAAAMYVAGRMPAGFHRWFARAVYNRRFFHTIVSYMPGARGPRWCAGAPVRAVYPVLPLAEGVPVNVGVVVSDGVVGVGVLLDRALGLDPAGMQHAVRAAFTGAGGRFGADASSRTGGAG